MVTQSQGNFSGIFEAAGKERGRIHLPPHSPLPFPLEEAPHADVIPLTFGLGLDSPSDTRSDKQWTAGGKQQETQAGNRGGGL